jgi:hypothetical protein
LGSGFRSAALFSGEIKGGFCIKAKVFVLFSTCGNRRVLFFRGGIGRQDSSIELLRTPLQYSLQVRATAFGSSFVDLTGSTGDE